MKKKSLKKIWQNKASILEGIKNNLFRQEDIENVASVRMEVCNKCEHKDNVGSECVLKGTQPCCGLCGCSLKLKLRVLHEECPAGKWKAASTLEQSFIIKEIVKNNEEIK